MPGVIFYTIFVKGHVFIKIKNANQNKPIYSIFY